MEEQEGRMMQLLRAGALLPMEGEVSSRFPVDEISARAYTHPCLGDRPVVRLVPEALSEGADLEMRLLAFEEPQVRPQLGRRIRRAVGFPDWVLANDPDHARHALDVMKELKANARQARQKIGLARDGFNAVGKKLARAVPHFLPTYYEEVGRTLLALESTKYASEYFNKAREAERTHGLKVDEYQRLQAFLEFALAGAISNKTMSDYSKELQASYAAPEAITWFRELCLRRTTGGMPPYKDMAKDLRRLAKAAELDMAAEDRRFLEDVLESPPLKRAALDFWEGYRKPLVELARASAKVRGHLLNLFPTPERNRRDFDIFWLSLLEECGALEPLWSQADNPETEPTGGRAAWLSKVIQRFQGYYPHRLCPPAVFALVRKMAKQLSADGREVALHRVKGYHNTIDVDILDLLLELSVPVAEISERSSVDLAKWANPPEPEGHLRDLAHVAGDPAFAPLLYRGLDQVMGKEPFETVAGKTEGLREVRRRWLLDRIGEMSLRSLPLAPQALQRLEGSTTAQHFLDFPDAYEALKAIQLWPMVAQVLREGLLDELGWPALEAAVEELNPDGKVSLGVYGAFPHLILHGQSRMVVLGPQGVILEHEPRVPPKGSVYGARYLDGQLLVVTRDSKNKVCFHWSGQPDVVHDLASYPYSYAQNQSLAVALPGGGITEGGRALMVGDTDLPTNQNYLSDGTHFWRRVWLKGSYRLREFDPRTGEEGRVSLPAFLEGFAAQGWLVDYQLSKLAPLPAGLENTPLGTKDGLWGCRVRKPHPKGENAKAPMQWESIDGIPWEGNLGTTSGPPDFLVAMPGHDRPRPVGGGYLWDGEGKAAVAQINDIEYHQATPLTLPYPFWHYLIPRDRTGSLALRALDDAKAQTLLEAAHRDLKAMEGDEDDHKDYPELKKALAEALPEVTHPLLRKGLMGVVNRAASLAVRLDRLVAQRGSVKVEEDLGPGVADKEIAPALRPLMGNIWNATGNVGHQITAACHYLTEAKVLGWPDTNIDWFRFLGRTRALAFLAASPATSEPQRQALLDFLEHWANSILVDPQGLRLIKVVFKEGIPFLAKNSQPTLWTLTEEGSRYFARFHTRDYQSGTLWYNVLERTTDGTFRLPEGSYLEEERVLTREWPSADMLLAMVGRLRAGDMPAWSCEAVEALCARTGLTRAEASLLWAGLPNLDVWGSSFLSKELAKTMGVKLTEASAARNSLKAITLEQRQEIMCAPFTDDANALWSPLGQDDEESPIARMARRWVDLKGKRVPIPDDLVVAAGKALTTPLHPNVMLAAAASPFEVPQFNFDCPWIINSLGNLLPKKEADQEVFAIEALTSAVLYLPWLYVSLPVGHPLRNNLPALRELALKRLKNPDLLFKMGMKYHSYSNQDEMEALNRAFLDGLGGEPFVAERNRPDEELTVEGRDNGILLALPARYGITIFVRPQAYSPDALSPAVQKLVEGINPGSTIPPLRAMAFLHSEGLQAMMDRVKSTPVPQDGWEANPLLSVAEIARAVQSKLSLSEDGAVLYLQTLALVEPTTKNVKLWNGWNTDRYKKAAAELVQAGLVLEAKRARAGRSHFLPGPWEVEKVDLPLESWKLPLYQANGARPLGRLLPLEPLDRIFRRAWQRIEAGDEPRYEEIK